MPRYLVERSFEEGLDLSVDPQGVADCLGIVENNSKDQVTWIHSYVRSDGHKAFDLYEAPTPEAIRHAAKANRLPIDRITEVRVLDPYFYLHARNA